MFPKINFTQNDQLVTAEFIDSLVKLSTRIGLPSKLRDVGIPKEACLQMSKDAMKQTRLLVNNPRVLEEKDAYEIYNAAW